MAVRLMILFAVCTALVTTRKIVTSDTTASPSELYRRYLDQVGGEGKQPPEVLKPVPRSTFDDALKAVKDAYQKAPVRPLPAPPKIIPVENKLDACPWTWLEYLGLTSFIMVIVGVIAGIIGCCFCCRGTGGTSNI